MKGADGSEWQGARGASGAAGRGQQEGHFNDRQRNLTFPDLARESKVEAAETARRVRQTEIKIDQRLAISVKVGGHGGLLSGFFLRPAASSSLSRTR